MSSEAPQQRDAFDTGPAVVEWSVARPPADARGSAWKGLAGGDRELDALEARALLDSIADAEPPRIVLSCAEGAARADLPELVRHVTGRGSGAIVEYAGRAQLDDAQIGALADAGVRAIALESEGADEATLEAVVRHGVSLEIVTRVDNATLDAVATIASRVQRLGAARWRVAFPVKGDPAWLDGERVDSAAASLLDLDGNVPFAVELEHLPHVVRLVAERARRRGLQPPPRPIAPDDGRGMLFISWCGDIYPSADLLLPCGNVRMQDVMAVYRFHPMFRMLRDPESLTDRCGNCEYRARCGGCRARAFADGGQVLASDPLCRYQPKITRTSFP